MPAVISCSSLVPTNFQCVRQNSTASPGATQYPSLNGGAKALTTGALKSYAMQINRHAYITPEPYQLHLRAPFSIYLSNISLASRKPTVVTDIRSFLSPEMVLLSPRWLLIELLTPCPSCIVSTTAYSILFLYLIKIFSRKLCLAMQAPERYPVSSCIPDIPPPRLFPWYLPLKCRTQQSPRTTRYLRRCRRFCLERKRAWDTQSSATTRR